MRIVVRKGGEVTAVREVTEDVVYLGRSRKNDLVLSDGSVSRRHAKIFRTGGKIFLEDLQSVNGTFVEGRRIRREELRGGSRFELGEFELTVEAGTGTEPPPESDGTANTTFAEATTALVSGGPTEAESFLDAIAVRPREEEEQGKRDVLRDFLRDGTDPTPAERMPMERSARLIRLDGPEAGEAVELSKPEVTLGRSTDADVVVEDPAAGDTEARIENTGDAYVLKADEGSTGTFVDGVPVRERELENHDIVQVGNARFEFVQGASRSKAEIPRARERPTRPAARGPLGRVRPMLTSAWALALYGTLLGVAYVLWSAGPARVTERPSAPPAEPARATPAPPAAEETARLVRFHIEKARSLLAARKLDEAEARLRAVLDRLEPDNGEAKQLLTQLEKAREAEEAGSRAAAAPERKRDGKPVRAPKRTAAENAALKKAYQQGVVKYEAGDFPGAERLLRGVAGAEGNPYQTSAKNLLADIGRQTTGVRKERLRSIRLSVDAGDLIPAHAEIRKLLRADPADAEAKSLLARVETELEAQARKAYQEGMAFLEVVEDREAALERFEEVKRLSPDPGMRYRKKAEEKIRQLKAATP